MVCGGDGTVGWALGCLDNVCQDAKCQSPPMAIIPLGTGQYLFPLISTKIIMVHKFGATVFVFQLITNYQRFIVMSDPERMCCNKYKKNVLLPILRCDYIVGNDLARVLRWGPGYNGQEHPVNLLRDLIEADEIKLDRYVKYLRKYTQCISCCSNQYFIYF